MADGKTKAVLVEFMARVCEKPAWGRQELLQVLSELRAKHRVPEDELDRALRLTMPQLLDLLFNRAPQLAEAVSAVLGDTPASHGESRDALGAHSPIAAVA